MKDIREIIRLLAPILIEVFAIMIDEPHIISFSLFALILAAKHSHLAIKKNVLCFLMAIPTSLIANIYLLLPMINNGSLLAISRFIILVYIFTFLDILLVLFIYAFFNDRSFKL